MNINKNIIVNLKSNKQIKLEYNKKYLIIFDDRTNWYIVFKFCKRGIDKFHNIYYLNLTDDKQLHKISAAYFEDHAIDINIIE